MASFVRSWQSLCGRNDLQSGANWYCYVIAHNQFVYIEERSNEPLWHYSSASLHTNKELKIVFIAATSTGTYQACLIQATYSMFNTVHTIHTVYTTCSWWMIILVIYKLDTIVQFIRFKHTHNLKMSSLFSALLVPLPLQIWPIVNHALKSVSIIIFGIFIHIFVECQSATYSIYHTHPPVHHLGDGMDKFALSRLFSIIQVSTAGTHKGLNVWVYLVQSSNCVCAWTL